MNVISLILTSTAIGAMSAALITWIANKSIQKDNFKNDYFKTVLQKRLDSYASVWKIFSMFPYKYQLGDEFFDDNQIDEIGYDHFHEILNFVRSISFDSYWLSSKMREEIEEFHELLQSFYDSYNGYPNEEVENMIKGLPDVKEHLIRLISIYTLDMESLYDLKSFFNQKKREPAVIWPKYFANLIKKSKTP